MLLDPQHPLAARTGDSRLIRAYRGDRPEVTPVWFMRQAGRSLPEYRERRAGTRMLDACLNPELAAELTLQPVRRHGVDAAVFFSDIIVPLRLAGLPVDIVPGVGPVIEAPIRSAADVAALPSLDPAELLPISDGVRASVAELGATPLVGFAGAPFTLASYLVEGGPSRDHLAARTLMHRDPETWAALAGWAADVTGLFLRAQVLAGASAVQLFDSWAGSLSPADYRRFAAPASARALGHVVDLTDPASAPVPVVHFGLGTATLLTDMRAVGASVIGVDYRTPLDRAIEVLGPDIPVQGNIDPAVLGADWPVLAEHARAVLAQGRAAIAHVANLGHGVPPDTDPDVLTRLVDLVHGYRP